MKSKANLRPYHFAFAMDQIIVALLFSGTFYYHQRDLPLDYLITKSYFGSILIHVSFFIALWLLFRINKKIIRYYHAVDFIQLILIVALQHIISFGINFINQNPARRFGKIYLESYIVTVACLIAFRYLISYFYERLMHFNHTGVKRNILIYGAGQIGLILKNSIESSSKQDYNIIGFVDDDVNKVGRYINGLRIYDATKDIAGLLSKHNISDIIISTNKMKPERKALFLEKMLQYGVKVRQTGSLKNWYENDFSLNKLSKLNINDLMSRQPIDLKNEKIESCLNEKVVLVTGAAGSIGSELVRKLVENKAYFIVCLDFSESALYDLQQGILSANPNINNLFFELGDIRDKEEMRILFEKYNPEIVFHAAAYKHVPLMEEHPRQAVRTNVLGTHNIVSLAVEFKIEKFILISTDKAVYPKSIMGITKRFAELIVRSYAGNNCDTKFMITRFGNVLGSNGSVVPLFKKQIIKGGPVTVTHPEMERYFMTIPEACHLVLEAFAMGCGGEIFVFDMGEPVKIIDLARNMIRLAGLVPDVDIKIEFSGIRKGEKLTEEIFSDRERFLNTHHEKIFISSEDNVNDMFRENLMKEIHKIQVIHEPAIYKEIIISLYRQFDNEKQFSKHSNELQLISIA